MNIMTADAFLRGYLRGGMALVMRGVPGAGKSTFVQKVRDAVISNEDEPSFNVASFSADSYRMVGDQYVYNPKDNPIVHGHCLRHFTYAAQSGLLSAEEGLTKRPVLICDNTNVNLQDSAPYMAVAAAFGWTPVLVTISAKPEVAGPRNLHSVPQSSVDRMANNLDFGSIPYQWEHVIIKD